MEHYWPCRTWLISTVENVKFAEKQRDSDADAIILELEAGTLNKATARVTAAEMLRTYDYGKKYRVVRINPMTSEHAVPDLEEVIPARPDAILMTKVYQPSEVEAADREITRIEKEHGLPEGKIEIAVMIETANAVFEVRQLAWASKRVKALCFGGGDFGVDVHTKMTRGSGVPIMPGIEMLWARSTVVAGARAAGVCPIDVPSAKIGDDPNLRVHTWESRALGFDGMIVLSPTSIKTVHEGYTPTPIQVKDAQAVVDAYEASVASGAGTVGVGGQMVSDTVVHGFEDELRRYDLSQRGR